MNLKTIREQLEQSGVKFVRILWCDNANIIRAKAAHIGLIDEGFAGVGISAAQQALPVMYDAVAPDSGLGPVGETQLVPDWSSLKVLPYAPGHAQVLGDMQQNGTAWEHCPRDFLRQQIKRLEQAGVSLKAAFENEFFLLKQTEETYEPFDRSVFAATGSMNQNLAVMLELSRALEAQGLIPEFYYPEAGPGQQELGIRYSDALGAADQQIIFRETARGVAQQHGLVASFLPKIIENAAGSGCHINVSLWRDKQNLTGEASHATGLSKETRAFIAGVLQHLPALCALTIPSRNSYRRIRPHFWAGAFRSWGYGNREASVRVTRGSEGANRFELKTADASANPYLALGGLIAAGLNGLEQGLELPPESTGDPGLLSESERQAMGADPLPQNLSEAIHNLEHSQVLLSALGAARAKAYVAVRRMEWEALKGASLEDEVKMLAERY